jgi:hypothetical protein
LQVEAGWALALALIGLCAWRLIAARTVALSRRTWMYLSMPVIYWALTAANYGPGRGPESSRYLYVGAVLLLLALTELGSGWRPGRRAGVLIAVALGFGVVANVGYLHESTKFLRDNAAENKAQLAALGLVRAHVPPQRTIEPLHMPGAPFADMVIPAGEYFSAARDFGTPAFSAASLPSQPEPLREQADREMAHALGIRLVPVKPAAAARGCRRFDPRARASVGGLRLPAAGLVLRAAPGAEPRVRLRRFAGAFAVRLPDPPRALAWSLRVPPDRMPLPWHALITAAAAVTICQ